jgi:DMSO/TMAO reductase YedYZ molybdopterin-dependent catalytic subunit
MNRRQLLVSTLVAVAGGRARAQIAIAGKRPMILHNDRPEDLETPSNYFDTWLTPIDAFFVRQHLPRPQVDLATYTLRVDGLVAKPLQMTLDDLRKLPQHTVPATLECAGNGRSFFRPRVPGIQWGRGSIGNAEWSGPTLRDILKLAEVKPAAGFLETDGADMGVAKTPDFVRSLAMHKALHSTTILALKMNGDDLPEIHGSPARLVVPGWDGASWVKWVIRFTVTAERNNQFFMNPGYRYPRHGLMPGGVADPSDLEVIEAMPVKSAIAYPSDEEHVKSGPITIRGYAWAGEERITEVDVSTDGGSTWQHAELSREDLPFAWRLWKLNWTPPRRGYFRILSRARDSSGRVQPIVAEWNPSGYLWNAIDRIGVVVEP